MKGETLIADEGQNLPGMGFIDNRQISSKLRLNRATQRVVRSVPYHPRTLRTPDGI